MSKNIISLQKLFPDFTKKWRKNYQQNKNKMLILKLLNNYWTYLFAKWIVPESLPPPVRGKRPSARLTRSWRSRSPFHSSPDFRRTTRRRAWTRKIRPSPWSSDLRRAFCGSRSWAGSRSVIRKATSRRLGSSRGRGIAWNELK